MSIEIETTEFVVNSKEKAQTYLLKWAENLLRKEYDRSKFDWEVPANLVLGRYHGGYGDLEAYGRVRPIPLDSWGSRGNPFELTVKGQYRGNGHPSEIDYHLTLRLERLNEEAQIARVNALMTGGGYSLAEALAEYRITMLPLLRQFGPEYVWALGGVYHKTNNGLELVPGVRPTLWG